MIRDGETIWEYYDRLSREVWARVLGGSNMSEQEHAAGATDRPERADGEPTTEEGSQVGQPDEGASQNIEHADHVEAPAPQTGSDEPKGQ